MQGCSSASPFVVNAEVDSMGGVVEGGVGVGTKTSPRRAAIDKVQSELRQEYDVREERRRELEFLEKGGNPLDFNFGKAASISVQSTSLTDQQPELEAKGSFAFTASPHGDSVESSGRPGDHSACEPNSADNLMLFDGESDFVEGDRSSGQPSRTNFAQTEHSSQQDGSQNTKELGDSAAFGIPRKAYKRRSRASRDGARSSSTDAVLAHGCHGSSLPSRHGPRESKGLVSDAENGKEHIVSSNGDSKPTSPDGVKLCKTVTSEGQQDMKLDCVKPVESTTNLIKSDPQDVTVHANVSKDIQNDRYNPQSVFDATKSPLEVAFEEAGSFIGREEVVNVGLQSQTCVPVTQIQNQPSSGQVNGFSTAEGGDKRISNDGKNCGTAVGAKVLDSESSCTHTSVSLEWNNDSEMCTTVKIIDSNCHVKGQTSVIDGKPTIVGGQMVEEKEEIKADDGCTFTNDECNSAQQSQKGNGFILKAQEEIIEGVFGLENDVENQNQDEAGDQFVESVEADGCNGFGSGTERRIAVPSGGNLDIKDENVCSIKAQGSTDSSAIKLPEVASPARILAVASDGQTSIDINKANEVDEDSILEEARMIEAKRKRIAELSMATLPTEYCRKSHWDFVLEEMSWLANDFAQERIWKITAAAQVCHQVAFTSQLRFHEQNSCWERKKVAHILARAVMEFWHSVEEKRKIQELQCSRKDSLALREYAVRFLKHNSTDVLQTQAEAPRTPDRISYLGTADILCENHIKEENLFYTVLPGSTEIYRRSAESHVMKYEKTGSSIQEEVETSACNAAAGFGFQDNAYEEDEGETSTYDTSVAFEGSKSSRFAQKKWKNSTKAYNARTCEFVADSPFMQCIENKSGNQQPVVMGKRPAGSLNVSFPTKRMRTNIRQRVLSPMTTKTDASSGDTNSFQDDQSTLHGGSHLPNNLEVELGDFEKQLPFDSAEISTKNKKKKKAKHLGSGYEQRWEADSNFHTEQRDHSKKRSESHQLESNCSSGLFGQHIAKKQKMMRPSLDNSFDSGAPIGGSAPSPVASQISNQNKLMKMFSGQDRGRKNKGLKMPACLPGSGSPWTLFEEQALVVLVHDLGPNWELVSDAINSTLQFKCIFRNPKECKERHKMLMEMTGDGADSAEDSGSSQPYSSTLPGIPKGCARQLFQRLQGPMEEDTLRCHFEKIIMIGQKVHCRKKQNDFQDPKQLQPPHGSHMLALSQFCPNYLSGGSVLTPLDLCDAPTPSSDILPLGYQGPHTGGLAISNQGAMAPLLNASAANASVPGSSNMIIGNNFPSSPGAINSSVRDTRYAVPRSASLSTEEQQRMQQFNPMLSGRNLPQSNLSSPGALPGNDRGVRMLPGGNAVGVPTGINRGLSISRPGFQGIASSSMLNSGMVAMPCPVNMHPGIGSGQGNSTRPHEALHMMRPSQNQDPQRQMMGPDLQMKVSQGNNQGIAPYGALSPSFPNQTASPPVSSYPLHHPQSHGMPPQQPHVMNPHHPHLQGTNHVGNPQHQAYAIHFAKGRQMQQRLLQQQQQQQQQQFASSNSMMPHVQTQTQLPISSSPQNNSPIHSQASSPPVSLSPLTSASSMPSLPQHQQKHQLLPHGLARNAQAPAGGLTNQIGKQRQRQPQQQQFQQAGRHHPQQRQQTQSQHQGKGLKVAARGNMMVHQNVPIDPSLPNGLSSNPANQSVEKGEETMHLLHDQGLYSGSAMNPIQSGKPSMNHSSNQSQPQQKMYSGQSSPLAKHLQIPIHSDTVSQAHVAQVASGPSSTAHQSVPPLVVASSNHQPSHVQPNQKLVNQNKPSVQRVLQQNRHMNSDMSTKLQGRDSQTDKNSTPSTCHMGVTATMPQTSNDATNVSQVLSPASAPQWRASEPLYDSGTSSPATNLSSIGTPSTNSAGNEPSSQVGQQGLGHRQSSGNLPPVGQDVSTQWQHQSSQLQSPSLVSLQHQQQTQLGGNSSSLYVRPTDSRLE